MSMSYSTVWELRGNMQKKVDRLILKYKNITPSPILRDILNNFVETKRLEHAIYRRCSLLRRLSPNFEDGEVSIFDAALVALSRDGNNIEEPNVMEFYLDNYLDVALVAREHPKDNVTQQLKTESFLIEVLEQKKKLAAKGDLRNHPQEDHLDDSKKDTKDEKTPVTVKEKAVNVDSPKKDTKDEKTPVTAKGTVHLDSPKADTKDTKTPVSTRDKTVHLGSSNGDFKDEQTPVTAEEQTAHLLSKADTKSTSKERPRSKAGEGTSIATKDQENKQNSPKGKPQSTTEERAQAQPDKPTSVPAKAEPKKLNTQSGLKRKREDDTVDSRVERLLRVFRDAKEEHIRKRAREGASDLNTVRFVRDSAENALTYLRANKMSKHKVIPELEQWFLLMRDKATALAGGRRRHFDEQHPHHRYLRPKRRRLTDSYRPDNDKASK